jgi:hypothetical protein
MRSTSPSSLARLALSIVVAAAAAACVHAASPSSHEPPDPPTPPPPCDEPALLARAVARDTAVKAPTPTELFVPETPLPLDVRGDTLRFEYRVDSVGRLDTASVVVARGTANGRFDAKMRARMLRMKFSPAQLEGCAVSGWGTITYTF